MANWRDILLKVSSDVEQQFDDLKVRLFHRINPKPLMIVPFIGHGTRTQLRLIGRVLEDNGITSAKDNDTLWQNLVNTYKRYESDEIPHAVVRARYGDQETLVTANDEGFFEVTLLPDEKLPRDHIWHEVELELVDFPQRSHPLQETRAVGKVIVPPTTAQFAVVSDLDDTVIRTDVLNVLKMARNTFLRNSRSRLPFEGVAAFYRALQAGVNNTFNPIFYVSSSPWNLYDLLMDFFDVRGIPIGPMFLKDLGLTAKQLIDSGHRQHKFAIIQQLLEDYPDLPFILIGDSGQRDPEIYEEVAHQYPNRILAIYIRDVNPGSDRDREVLRIADDLRGKGIDLLLVPDTVGAAEHAVLKGFIPEAAMMEIRVERTEDQKPPEKLEKLIDPNASAEDLYDEAPEIKE
jgi:phosphatidate phosphatase APP1